MKLIFIILAFLFIINLILGDLVKDISLINKIINNLDYKSNSWILNSNFDYNYPKLSILNIAYPSAIAQYYVTIIPPESTYLFLGKFLKENMYESSLTVYYENGLLDNNYKSQNTFLNDDVNLTVNNNSSQLLYVFQRFYPNMEFYTKKNIIDNLVDVYNLENNRKLKPLDSIKRDFYSELIYKPLEDVVNVIAPKSECLYWEFFYPGQNLSGLFPDENHYYLFSCLGKFNIIEVTGNFKSSDILPYMDFITVDQNTTQTNFGLPFYKMDENYKFYIISPDVTKYKIMKYNLANKIILKWNKNNKKPGIIFRVINYSNLGIANATTSLSPEETKNEMNFGLYPTMKIID